MTFFDFFIILGAVYAVTNSSCVFSHACLFMAVAVVVSAFSNAQIYWLPCMNRRRLNNYFRVHCFGLFLFQRAKAMQKPIQAVFSVVLVYSWLSLLLFWHFWVRNLLTSFYAACNQRRKLTYCFAVNCIGLFSKQYTHACTHKHSLPFFLFPSLLLSVSVSFIF